MYASGLRSGQSGHCAGELEEEIRSSSGQRSCFSLAQTGIYFCWINCEIRAEVRPHYSLTHSSFLGTSGKVLILRSLCAFLNLRAPRAHQGGPCVLSLAIRTLPINLGRRRFSKAPGFHLGLLALSRLIFLALWPNGLQMSVG